MMTLTNIKTMPLSKLNPATYNPRSISDQAMQGLEASIKRFGLVEPIIYNERTGNVVGGHQRLKVLTKQGIESTDVVIVDLPEIEEKALNVALNNPLIAGDFTEDLEAIQDELALNLRDVAEDLRIPDIKFDSMTIEEDHLSEIEFDTALQPYKLLLYIPRNLIKEVKSELRDLSDKYPGLIFDEQ